MPKENETNRSEEFSELDWVALQNTVSDGRETNVETDRQKLARKIKENPFVPIGCLVTAGVLCFGLRSFISGDRHTSQRMMRYRVLAQGSTLVALLAPLLYAASTGKK